MLSEINHGHRRKKDNLTYPLRELTRGQKISYQDLIEIKTLLETSTLPMTQIAKQYNVTVNTIRSINQGKRHYQSE